MQIRHELEYYMSVISGRGCQYISENLSQTVISATKKTKKTKR